MSSSDAKPVTEKKGHAPKTPKAPKASKVKTKLSTVSSSTHPTYFQMIKEAILALHERTGSSPYAIAKYMEEKHMGELPANFRKVLAIQLRNLAVKEKLLKVKSSFKLSDSAKQEGKKSVKVKASKVKKPKVAVKGRKAVGAPKKPTVTAKAANKAVVMKKVKAVPVKPKQPKSIKSFAAKRAKKVTA